MCYSSRFPFTGKHILQNGEILSYSCHIFVPDHKTPCLAECTAQPVGSRWKCTIHRLCYTLSFPYREPEERQCHRPGSNVAPSSKPRPRRTLEQSSSSLSRHAQSARRRNPPPRTLLPLAPSLIQSSAAASIDEVIRGTRL